MAEKGKEVIYTNISLLVFMIKASIQSIQKENNVKKLF